MASGKSFNFFAPWLTVENLFTTVRDTQRGSEFHGEEKTEEGDRGDQEEKKGNQKGEGNLSSNQFPMCSPQSETLKEFHRVT